MAVPGPHRVCFDPSRATLSVRLAATLGWKSHHVRLGWTCVSRSEQLNVVDARSVLRETRRAREIVRVFIARVHFAAHEERSASPFNRDFGNTDRPIARVEHAAPTEVVKQ